MKTFKARGIVLREYEAGESDKRLVLLCKELGRLTVYARGARKIKSKFLAAAQLFTYSDFVLTEGSGFNSVNQADVIENFYALRTDYPRLCHAHLMLEICEKTIMESNPCDELLYLLLKSLSFLNKPPSSEKITLLPEQVSLVFMFRFYLFYGIAPSADVCSVCGAEAVITAGGAHFCDEGYVCPSCARHKTHRVKLSHTAWAALRYILESEGVTEAFMWSARPLVVEELNKAARLCWKSHFQWTLQSDELI